MKKTELFEEGAEVSGSLAKKTAKAVVVSGIAVFMAFIILASSFLSIPGLLISDLGDYVDKKFTEWKVNKSVTAIVNSFEDIEDDVSKEIIDEIQDGYIPTWKKDVKNYWKNEKVTDFGINNDDIYGTKDLVGWKLYSENQTAAYTGARFENYYRVSGQSDKLDSIYFMCAYAVWHQSHNTSSEKKDVKDLSQEDLDKRWQNFDISGLKTFIKDNKYKILRVNFTYSNDTVHRKVSNGDVTQDFDVPMRTLSFDLKVATNDEIASIFNLSEDEQEVAQTYANMSTALFESAEEGSSKATKLSFDPISAVLQKVYGIKGESTTEIFANAKKQDNKGFEIAIEEELIIKNPMKKRKARKPQSVKSDKKVTSLTVSEENQLVNYLLYDYEPRPNRYNIKYQLLIELFSGLRMGEINALTRSDIDFKNSVINVNKTITNTRDEKPKIGKKPKTYCGNREVPISKRLEPILKEAVQCSKGNPNGLLFYNKVNKTLVTTNQVNLAFKTICKNAGINKPDVNQHMLRHTFTTRCVEAHIPPEVLKSWLGHSSVDITIDIYTDIQKRFETSEIKKLDDYLDNHICN